MNKKDYPLWLKIALKLPLRWKHWIREQARMTECWSELLVLEDSTSLLMLIENTDTPNFAEFERRLSEVKKAWGKHDSMLEGLSVRQRFLEFKTKHRAEPNASAEGSGAPATDTLERRGSPLVP
jgi:hypothetical protein